MRCNWKIKRSKSMKMKRESDDKPIMFDLLFSLVLLDMLESEVRRAIIFFFFFDMSPQEGGGKFIDFTESLVHLI
jgi:hypothetical protein